MASNNLKRTTRSFKVDEIDPLDLSREARTMRVLRGLLNSRYLALAFIIHVVFFAIWGGATLFERIEMNGQFDTEQVLVASPPGPPPPPPSMPSSQNVDEKATEAVAAKPPTNQKTRIATAAMSTEGINVPPPDLPPVDLNIKTDDNVAQKLEAAEVQRMGNVRRFFQGGVKGGNGQPGATGHDKSLVAEFTCYVGRYQGGDWDCNLGFLVPPPPAKTGKWYGNCIYNLMLQINRWSHGNIKAKLKPEFLKLSDREWIDAVKPPFVFITGHKDFKFSPAEVENLREYLMVGGCLWADNSLPGRRSRFDIALRRELKKVLPDRDFEKLPNGHPVFNSFFNMSGPPKGVNFYQEPVEVIKIGGDVSVFYTLNAYSNLWQTALDERDQPDAAADWIPERQEWVNRSGPLWTHNYVSGTGYNFFRNMDKNSVLDAYRFGINIVAYLLTRFQQKFMTLPSSA